ncbi:hypothetical protein YTPLAS18_28650 [Nitrospira sp.]|nr:hypothetical protein YTPLAS18_28650 [Nitrospira sp.]
MNRMRVARAYVVTALLLGWSGDGRVFAWDYPEHRDIAILTLEHLDPALRSVFDRFWSEARQGHQPLLCEQGADKDQGVMPTCIDWAALSAIGGDHSCSSQEMSDTVLNADWILKVAHIAAQLKVDLSRITDQSLPGEISQDKLTIKDLRRRLESERARAERLNALRTSDTNLQRADPRYATRADANLAHFLLARPRPDISPLEYAQLTLTPGSELNALGVWGTYHLEALQKATRLAKETLTPDEHRALVFSMLFDEAFALHFLEDAFSAGHVAGSWGVSAQRKGTHDIYNQIGIEVFPWVGKSESMVLRGDAHMRQEDAERAAHAARLSLGQVLDTATGVSRPIEMPYTPAAPMHPGVLDVCKTRTFPLRPEGLRVTPEALSMGYEVLALTPVPGLGPGIGALPRYRSEMGPFIGLAGAVDGQYVSGGFTPSQGGGVKGTVDLSVRLGLGLDGVIGDAGDGLIFLAFGLRGDSSSSNSIADPSLATQGGNISSAIPARVGLSTRLRMPFYVIPGDLLLLAPLYFLAPDRYIDMAITASNGGLLGWQTGWATPIGRFQFVAGRELGVTVYGLIGEDRVIAPSATPGGNARVVDYKSIYLEMPVVEYRPFRAFSSNQSSAVLFQVFAGVNIPTSASVVTPAGAPGVSLDTVWTGGLRVVFDWRYYP